VLHGSGWSHEHPAYKGFLLLLLLLVMFCPQVDGQNVAVEVDGSHHYTNSLPHMPLSEVVVRRRMLQVRLNSHPSCSGSTHG
jgi:hypothetical protein